MSDASRLCTSCGMCCKGLLHSRAKLEPTELPVARKHGLEVVENGELAFRLPCPRFEGCCTIYPDRPRACRKYRCALLRRLDSEEIGVEPALAIVAEAKRLLDLAADGLEETVFLENFWAHIREFHAASKTSESAARRSHLSRLRFTSFGLYLDKHFVLDRDGNFFSTKPLEAGICDD